MDSFSKTVLLHQLKTNTGNLTVESLQAILSNEQTIYKKQQLLKEMYASITSSYRPTIHGQDLESYLLQEIMDG